jgi:hypothetical protein
MGEEIAKIAQIIILVFVAVIATRLESQFEAVGTKLESQFEAVGTKLDAKFRAVERKLITEERLTAVISEQVAPLGNVRFYPSEGETFRRLAGMTWRAQRVVKATRLSPGDITMATEGYWEEVKRKACDPSVFSIRIHSLAHPAKKPVRNVCRLIEELRDAQNFQLGIAFFENEFEIIMSDNKECIVCFHQLGQIIGNGLHFDSTLPKGKEIVDNFGETFTGMQTRCHVLIDFDEWVNTKDDIKKLQAFVHRAHEQYLAGTEPKPYGDDPEFLKDKVFGKEPTNLV